VEILERTGELEVIVRNYSKIDLTLATSGRLQNLPIDSTRLQNAA
jgi:hypothetical protein